MMLNYNRSLHWARYSRLQIRVTYCKFVQSQHSQESTFNWKTIYMGIQNVAVALTIATAVCGEKQCHCYTGRYFILKNNRHIYKNFRIMHGQNSSIIYKSLLTGCSSQLVRSNATGLAPVGSQ